MNDKIVKADLMVVQLDRARTALAEAKTIGETKKVMDMAHAAQIYARRQQLGEEAMAYALAIKIEALRKLGEMLAVTPKNIGGKPVPNRNRFDQTDRLADLGIDKKTSMIAQQLAQLEPEKFAMVKKTGELHKVLNLQKQELKVEMRTALAKKAREEIASERDEAKIITGDFRDIMASMADESVDMIFTDPPYDEASIPLYGDMARLAARVLKPNGSLITYVGHYAVIEAGVLMRQHLRFWWTIALVHSGHAARLPGKWVFVEWKPLMWFVKGGRNNNNNFVTDLYKSKPPTKNEHDWQQDTSEACYYIEQLTMPGDIVLDPFAGSGTTILAANSIGRRAIGIELDDERAMIARGRINAIS